MTREFLLFIRSVIDQYFPDQYIDPETVLEIGCEAHVIDFPRSLFCDCMRCRSAWVQKSILGNTITLITLSGEYSVFVPADGKTLEHRWT